MKFYGNGVVWDAENNKALCTFPKCSRYAKAELEVTNQRIASALLSLGYDHEDEITKKQIMKQLDEAGISYKPTMKKSELLELLKGVKE